MAHSGSRSSQRAEVAPPRDSSSRSKRNGYVLLAVSGVVLATAFGGLAQLSSSSTNTASGDFPGGNANSASGPQLIPGNPVPGTTTVNGTAQPDPATSPTAVVSVGPDGKPVVTILPAPGSGQKPVVLAPGTPIPAGTYIPPGTQIPPSNPVTPSDPGKDDPPPTSSHSKPPSSTPPSSSQSTPPSSESSTPPDSTPPSSESSTPPSSSTGDSGGASTTPSGQ